LNWWNLSPARPHDIPDIRYAFLLAETRPLLRLVAFSIFSWRMMFLDAHLADLLSADRRWRVRFKTRPPR
jgi:hypothetical protein